MTHNPEFEKLARELNRSMINDYHAVDLTRNPLAIYEVPVEGLEHTLLQYTIFPRNIVSFLTSARDTARSQNMESIAQELTRNIGEELGTETAGVSHYDLLTKGIVTELYAPGSDAYQTQLDNLRNLEPSTATQKFIDGVHEIVTDGSLPPRHFGPESSRAIGAAYALEASAVPELTIVYTLLNNLVNAKTDHPIADPTLKQFFRNHLYTWEPGHEAGLRNAASEHIKEHAHEQNFRDGFHSVMKTMDTWWDGMYEDAQLIHSK